MRRGPTKSREFTLPFCIRKTKVNVRVYARKLDIKEMYSVPDSRFSLLAPRPSP